ASVEVMSLWRIVPVVARRMQHSPAVAWRPCAIGLLLAACGSRADATPAQQTSSTREPVQRPVGAIPSTPSAHSNDSPVPETERQVIALMKYHAIGTRPSRVLRDSALTKDIDGWAAAHPSPGLEALIRYALELTAQRLDFVFEHADSDPN